MRIPDRLRSFLPALGVLIMFGAAARMAFVGTDPDCPSKDRIRGMDLVSYWVGGEIVAEGLGARLYVPAENKPRFKALYPKRPPHYPIGYPPPIYQLFGLPHGVDYFVVVKGVLFAVAALQLAGARWVVAAVPALAPWRREALFFAFVMPGGVSAVLTGQLGGLWTAAVGGAFLARAQGRPAAGGACLSLLFLKPTLAAPVAVALALCGEGAMVAAMVAGGAAILGLSLLGGGSDAWLAYADKLAHPDKLMSSFWIWWTRQMTLRSLLPKLMPDMASARLVGFVSMGVAAGLLGWMSWVARGLRRRNDAFVADFSLAATLSAALLAAPHLLDYDLGLHLPALALSAAYLLAGRARWPRVGWMCLAFAWSAGWFPKLNMLVLLNVSVLSLAAWVVWMLAELRAVAYWSPKPAAQA